MNSNSELIFTVWETIRALIRSKVDIRAEQNFAVGVVLMHVCSASTVPSHLSFRVLDAAAITDLDKSLAKVRLQVTYGSTEKASLLQVEFAISVDALREYVKSLQMQMSDFSLQRDDENEGRAKRIGAFLQRDFDVMNFEFSRTGPSLYMGLWLNNNGLSKSWYTVYRPEV